MINLGKNSIQLNAQAANKADAIRQAGELLIRNGNMKPGYIDSMMNREKVAHTYLGNGIAIPHGLPHDRDLILETGISVVQVPKGVEWNPGEVVYLVVGIAAKSDEHIEVLSNLTQVLDDEAAVHRLAQTADPLDIVETLTHQRPADESSADGEPDFAKTIELTIAGKAGLHARPATTFVNIAKSFDSEIRVRYGNKTANGKSMVSLLKLGVEGGSTVRIMARGTDEDEALQALEAAVVAGLEDEEEVAPTPTLDWMPTF
ncbi:PTS fructose transporter subunit IIA, partial [filamentous cyanobacterium CCP2]